MPIQEPTFGWQKETSFASPDVERRLKRLTVNHSFGETDLIFFLADQKRLHQRFSSTGPLLTELVFEVVNVQDGIMVNQKFLMSILKYDTESGVFTWRAAKKGKKDGQLAGTVSRGYVRIGISGKLYMAHILAWIYVYGKAPDKEIDHVNGVRSDNRIENLRLATRSQNCINKKSSRGRRKGVYWNSSRNKWVAQIGLNGSRKTIGYFTDESDAISAYRKHSEIQHGDFANI